LQPPSIASRREFWVLAPVERDAGVSWYRFHVREKKENLMDPSYTAAFEINGWNCHKLVATRSINRIPGWT